MKVKKIENLVGISLGVSAEDFHKVAKYSPEALKMVDENDNEIFAVDACDGTFCGQCYGELKDYSAVFINVNDKLIAWIGVPPEGLEDAKQWMLDEYGIALAHLSKVEKQIQDAVDEAEEKVRSIASSIGEVEL